MSVPEPVGVRRERRVAPQPRWRWWYSGISDWMIRNPGKPLSECATDMGKHVNTISIIVNSDMFRDFHAARLREWREMHDHRISSKLLEVTEQGLDLTLELMKDKGTKLPPAFLKEMTSMGLDALGYGPKAGPATTVNVDARSASVVVPVDAGALAEAREALRLAEARRGASGMTTLDVDAITSRIDSGEAAARKDTREALKNNSSGGEDATIHLSDL